MIAITDLVVTTLLIQSLHCTTSNNRKINQNMRLNYFDTDLLHYTAEDLKGNVVISPASIKSTLAMLIEGASGATEMEIRNALRLSPRREEFREQLSSYLGYLQVNKSHSSVQNANAIFVRDNLKLKKEFDTMLRKVYFSEIHKINFKDVVQSANIINNWISNKTRTLIPHIIDPAQIDLKTNIIMINALYFKSTWKHAFDPHMTRGECFYDRGVCKTAAMMELQAELNYAYVENLRAHALELPYDDGRYSMILLVPLDRDGISALIRDLPYMSLPQISALFYHTDVELIMPKFTIEYSQDMVSALRKMHITTLFSISSNLSGIFEGEAPQVNSIYHRVHISVDEAGTVAAAASAAMIVPLIGEGVQLKVDRPFVFVIRDNDLGIVLFEGKIEDPTEVVQKRAAAPSPVKKRVPARRNLYG